MKKSAFLLILLFGTFLVSGQDIFLTFTGKGESQTVDLVTATNMSTGQSVNFSGNQTLVLNQSTGIEDFYRVESGVSVYPNPFSYSSTLVVNQVESENIVIEIWNLIGQQVYQSNHYLDPGQHSFALSLSKPGVYYIKIEGESRKQTVKTICTESGGSAVSLAYSGYFSDFDNSNDTGRQKSGQTYINLDYTSGDVLAFDCSSGRFITTITDSPIGSRNYEIEFVDCTDPDGKTYPLVKIGDQLWMAENLAYLPEESEPGDYTNGQKYFVYGFGGSTVYEAKKSTTYERYGVLYNIEAALLSCPSGWHLPSDREWKTLELYLGMDSLEMERPSGWTGNKRNSGEVGSKLKSDAGWYYNTNGDNISRFNAQPGGQWTGVFCGAGELAHFWSSSCTSYDCMYEDALYRWVRSLGSDIGVCRTSYHPSMAISVRCIAGPLVTTNSITNIRDSSAAGGGNVNYSFGGPDIISKGVCWSTHHNPTTSDNFTNNDDGVGDYQSALTELDPNTRYYVRAYSTTAEGRSYYGEQKTFKTIGGYFIDNRDSSAYAYADIGSQTWIVKNMAYLPEVSDSLDGSEDGSYYYVYGHNGNSVTEAKKVDNYNKYGVLYNWEAAVNACPKGWHLPGDEEWKILERYLGMKTVELNRLGWRGEGGCDYGIFCGLGDQLKSKKGWPRNVGYFSSDGNGNNKSNFNAIPGGNRNEKGDFSNSGYSAEFWSESRNNSYAYIRVLGVYGGISRETKNTKKGLSVRCVRYNSPMVITSEIVNITESTAECSGHIYYPDNQKKPISMGFCWGENENPTINDDKTTEEVVAGMFTSKITEMTPKTTYYLRAYFTIYSGETLYGDQLIFTTTDGSFVDTRDSTKYGYINIGNLSWMAENLSYLPAISSWEQESNDSPEYYVNGYNGENINEALSHERYEKYGTLYNWEAALEACPEGWRLPNDDDWNDFTNYLIDSGYGFDDSGDDIGKSLASKSGWPVTDKPGYVGNDQTSNNSSGFNALPGGYYKYLHSSETSFGRYVSFWSASQTDSSTANASYLEWNSDELIKESLPKSRGFSIRCTRGKGKVKLITRNISSVTDSSAIGGAYMRYPEDVDLVDEWGLCWNTKGNPTVAENKTLEEIASNGFSSQIIDQLLPGTTYCVRAYAITVNDSTIYGNQVFFATELDSIIDQRDGTYYEYVTIGEQTWMADNLAYLPSVGPFREGSTTDKHYYVYRYEGSNVQSAKSLYYFADYGVLYNWPAAKTACPVGWNLPSDDDWKVLERFLGMSLAASNNGGRRISGDVSEKLKSKNGWIGNKAYNGDNSSGFNAKPGGWRRSDFDDYPWYYSDYAKYWTSTLRYYGKPWYRSIGVFTEGIYRSSTSYSDEGLSIRCIKN